MQHFCIKDKITAAQKTNVESLALRIRTLMFTQSNDQIDQFCLCYKRKGHVISNCPRGYRIRYEGAISVFNNYLKKFFFFFLIY